MAKTKKSKYSLVPMGFEHFLRSGAGVHKDKKKDADKKACRGKVRV